MKRPSVIWHIVRGCGLVPGYGCHPEEKESNKFGVVAREDDCVDYAKVGDEKLTRRKAREFHKLFERIHAPIE